MKRISLIPVAVLVGFVFQCTTAFSQEISAKEIVRKANDKANGQTSKGTMKMTIVRPDWSREVTMKSWSRSWKWTVQSSVSLLKS